MTNIFINNKELGVTMNVMPKGDIEEYFLSKDTYPVVIIEVSYVEDQALVKYNLSQNANLDKFRNCFHVFTNYIMDNKDISNIVVMNNLMLLPKDEKKIFLNHGFKKIDDITYQKAKTKIK